LPAGVEIRNRDHNRVTHSLKTAGKPSTVRNPNPNPARVRCLRVRVRCHLARPVLYPCGTLPRDGKQTCGTCEVEEKLPEDKREHEKDLRERDKFSKRVRQRDKDKTKKVIEDHLSRTLGAAAEAALW
jgi:hypothetical protein